MYGSSAVRLSESADAAAAASHCWYPWAASAPLTAGTVADPCPLAESLPGRPDVQPAAASAAAPASATPEIRRVQRLRCATDWQDTRCACTPGPYLLRCRPGPR